MVLENKWYYDLNLKTPVYVFNTRYFIKDEKPYMVKARVPVPNFQGRIHFEIMPIAVSDLAQITHKPLEEAS
jgi:hypothetical protein